MESRIRPGLPPSPSSTYSQSLTEAMKVVDEVGNMKKIVAGDYPSEWDDNRVTEMVRVTEERMFLALSAMKDKPKGRFLPDIEDLSHTIDFEEPKCGECGGSGNKDPGYSTCRCHEGSDESCKACSPDPCPECGGKEK